MSSITKETYKAGDYVFHEGDLESHFFIIESGEVHILTQDKMKQQIVVAKLYSGDSFGEFALIDQSPRSASAFAKTDLRLMKISKEGYAIMINDLPIWASSMLKSFSARILHMNETLKELTEALKQGKY